MTPIGRQRLHAGTLACARADALPDYDRSGASVIAHLGFGAFARAHAAVYADDLLRRGTPALIRGISLRSRRAAGRTRAPGRPLHRRRARARRGRVAAGGGRAGLHGDRAGRRARGDGVAGDIARDVDHHGKGLRGRPRGAVAVGELDLRTGAHRVGPGPSPPGRVGATGLRLPRQPPGQRERPAGAGPRKRRRGRSVAGGMDRRQGSLPQFGRGSHGAGSHRTATGRTSPPTSAWSTRVRSAPNAIAPGSSDPSLRWHRWARSAWNSLLTLRRSSDASCGS